jgi:hypothetical protein
VNFEKKLPGRFFSVYSKLKPDQFANRSGFQKRMLQGTVFSKRVHLAAAGY